MRRSSSLGRIVLPPIQKGCILDAVAGLDDLNKDLSAKLEALKLGSKSSKVALRDSSVSLRKSLPNLVNLTKPNPNHVKVFEHERNQRRGDVALGRGALSPKMGPTDMAISLTAKHATMGPVSKKIPELDQQVSKDNDISLTITCFGFSSPQKKPWADAAKKDHGTSARFVLSYAPSDCRKFEAAFGNRVRVLTLSYMPEAHSKYEFFALASQDASMKPFLPDTWLSHKDFAHELGKSSCDTYFFKEGGKDNGAGVVPFCISDASESKFLVADRIKFLEKVIGRELQSRKLDPGGGVSTFDLSGECSLPDGIYQRAVPRALLWEGHKFDLRVYVCMSPFPAQHILVYRHCLLRVAPKTFDADSVDMKVQTTHACGGGRLLSSEAWPMWETCVLPRVRQLVDTTMSLLLPKFPRSYASELSSLTCLWGFDIMVQDGFDLKLLEINTAPQLTYNREKYQWLNNMLHGMLKEFYEVVVIPFFTGEPPTPTGNWVRANA